MFRLRPRFPRQPAAHGTLDSTVAGILRRPANFPSVRTFWFAPVARSRRRAHASTQRRLLASWCVLAPAARLRLAGCRRQSRGMRTPVQAADRPARQGRDLGADQRRARRAHAADGAGHGRRTASTTSARATARSPSRRPSDFGARAVGVEYDAATGAAGAVLRAGRRRRREACRSSRATSSRPTSAPPRS